MSVVVVNRVAAPLANGEHIFFGGLLRALHVAESSGEALFRTRSVL